MVRVTTIALLAAAMAACVPAGEEAAAPSAAPSAGITAAPFRPLDAGAYEQSGAHFKVRAYGGDNARRILEQAESDYQTIMIDTNLFSFSPGGLYEIVVYADQREYVEKTGQPPWSGGVTYGNAICSYNDASLNQTVAHEMTHLIFNEFMGRFRRDLLWMNEGLAVYEQAKAASGKKVPMELFPLFHAQMRAQPLAMDELMAFVPLSHQADANLKVTLWYAQSESMVQFMLDRGGTLGFSQLMQTLKDGRSFDEAFRSAYSGVWPDLAGFLLAWKTGAP